MDIYRLMRTRWAASMLVLGLTGSGALAQEAETPVGPPALRDFSLPGTVTVPQEPAPEPAAPPPEAQEPPVELASPPPAPPPPRREPTPTPAPRAERTPPPVVAQPAPAPQTVPSVEPVEVAPPVAVTADPPPEQPPLPAAADRQGGDSSWLFGLLAVLAGMAGLALLWRKWRSAPARHDASLPSERAEHPAPSPAAEPAAVPAPIVAPPAEAPATAAPRARVELVFKPARAEATPDGASVHYELVVKNLGSMGARNVRIEARIFNAGSGQDAEIGAFFANPLREGLATRPFEIPARSQARLSRVVSLDNAHVRPVTIQGRRLFIPMVAFNILYEWGEGDTGQTSRCFVVGREAETPSEKMGAFRLDLGPRIYRSVGQRQTGLARIA